MIKLIKSSFHNEQETKKALSKFVLEQKVFSMGEECSKFETSFALKQNRGYAVYVANGSVANFLLIQALLNIGKLKKGDKVGVSALTWPTNVMPLIQLGLETVPIDCSLDTLNVSPTELNKTIADIRCLFITNVLGFCDDLKEIQKICKDNEVILLEDNCESLGSSMDKNLLGNFGLASTFSMFVGHHMSTIEGGMVCTDDFDLYEQLIISRAHGWDRNLSSSTQKRLREENSVDDFYARYTFYEVASNFRPSEINGFIGNIQIDFWDEIVNKRAKNFDIFSIAMNKNDDFYKYSLEHMDIVSNFAMPIICKSGDLANHYRNKFESSGVEIRPVIAGNITKQPFYLKHVSKDSHCPNSDLVHSNGFYFGNNPDLTNEEVSKLCELVASR